MKSKERWMYPGTRPSNVGNSHREGVPPGPINGIVRPRPDIFQSPWYWVSISIFVCVFPLSYSQHHWWWWFPSLYSYVWAALTNAGTKALYISGGYPSGSKSFLSNSWTRKVHVVYKPRLHPIRQLGNFFHFRRSTDSETTTPAQLQKSIRFWSLLEVPPSLQRENVRMNNKIPRIQMK